MDRVQHQLILLAVVAAACGRPAAGGEANARRPVVVDSAVPREIALEKFRRGLAQPAGFTGGAPDRDALVAAFVRAVETADTSALASLTLSRAEFAWLYYPTNAQGLPPYDLSPELMWFLLEGGHDKGQRRLLEDFGGRPLGYAGYRCDATPSREGENTAWGPCVVRRVVGRDTVETRLFGLIVARQERYKFVSLANKL